MDKIAKVRKEIERRKGYISVTHFAEELLSFLDTLSEEPDKDLEEAAEEYATTHLRNNEFPTADSAFIAGAKWQAEQDDRDVVFWKGMKYAIAEMKKEAVEGFTYPCLTPQGEAKIGVVSGALPKGMNIKSGDNVKLIIIKDDGKPD